MAIDLERLREALRALVDMIVAEIGRLRTSGGLELQRVEYVLRRDYDLRYYADKGLLNIADETCEEIEWPREEVEIFFDEVVRPSREYLLAASLVPDPDRLLLSFVWTVAYEAAVFGSPNCDAHIDSLVCDVTHAPREFRMKLWLTGLQLNDDEILVSKALTLRRPNKRDLQIRVPAESREPAYSGLPPFSFTCLADLRMTLSGERTAQVEADRLITILRLFRLGSVASSRIDTISESFYSRGSHAMRAPNVIGCHVSEVSGNDAESLAALLETLGPLTPSRYGETDRPHDYISTALDWYSRSLLESGPWEARIAWAVVCLEALFGDSKTELNFRLSLRIVSLLRCLGFKPLEIKKNMSRAYDVRSKYVHGVPRKEGSAEDVRELLLAVADYARVACVVMMQLNTKFEKKAILLALDEALIDDVRREEVQAWCSQLKVAET